MYYILCRGDIGKGGKLGQLQLAIDHPFIEFRDALYAMHQIPPSKTPTVVRTVAYRDEIDKVHIMSPDAPEEFAEVFSTLAEMQAAADQQKKGHRQ